MSTTTSTVRKGGRRKLTLAQQALALKVAYPSHPPVVRGGRLIWGPQLRPSAASDLYTIHLEYTLESPRPNITVQEPALERPDDKPLPHTFDGDELCLHYPEEWLGDKAIALTVAPWISEWLLYYELWVITRKWLGGGHGTALPEDHPRDTGPKHVA